MAPVDAPSLLSICPHAFCPHITQEVMNEALQGDQA